ncbi:phosphoenolpyruvate--protein phosphotransferase [Marinicrinis lubricantis]|uniref:Phosphoenolpyruvate-protein phosphotransferase n=1 Tax=Marinicrinis lubricantis TaxID=2086470 RepID=A0ABW1IQM3_9BACL
MINGIGASSGIALGKAFVLPDWEWDLQDKKIDVSDLTAEFERLYDGIRTSKHEIEHMKEEISGAIGLEESHIFDAHLAILEDPAFMNEVKGIIRRQYKAAEVAVKEAIEHFTDMFDLLEDQYMKERALDIKDVGNRLLKHLLGTPEIVLPYDNQPFILVARELSPSQLAHLNPSHVVGIITLEGGETSHAAILARALGIPFVLGLEGKLNQPILTNDYIIMDGETGRVYINPDQETIALYEKKKQRWIEEREKLQEVAQIPSQTKDGLEFDLSVNISSVRELDHPLVSAVKGVGLFRTEFLYMDRDSFPSEEEQYEVYKEAAEKLDGKPMIIRTFDIGGDKQLDYFTFLEEEDNPFLGYRALRICLDKVSLFKTQLKAILRAGVHGNIKLMYPMVTSLEEVRKAKLILEECKQELREKGIPYADQIQVGITIEVPAAAAIADMLAEEVDFFSIGTNDLVQYILAVDRMNEKIADLYEPFHPAVIRYLKVVAGAAQKAGIELSVCGELAGDERALPLWIALGIHKLSMSLQSVLNVKNVLVHLDASASDLLLDELMSCRTSEEIKALLDRVIERSQQVEQPSCANISQKGE